MISDCEHGKIDMIITKSISRFARNTVDTIETVRKLKATGVGVFFEKENIWTLDSKGEFVLIVEGADPDAVPASDVETLDLSQDVRTVVSAAKRAGLSRNEAYRAALREKQRQHAAESADSDGSDAE